MYSIKWDMWWLVHSLANNDMKCSNLRFRHLDKPTTVNLFIHLCERHLCQLSEKILIFRTKLQTWNLIAKDLTYHKVILWSEVFVAAYLYDSLPLCHQCKPGLLHLLIALSLFLPAILVVIALLVYTFHNWKRDVFFSWSYGGGWSTVALSIIAVVLIMADRWDYSGPSWCTSWTHFEKAHISCSVISLCYHPRFLESKMLRSLTDMCGLEWGFISSQ